jgi:hypothetical protein
MVISILVRERARRGGRVAARSVGATSPPDVSLNQVLGDGFHVAKGTPADGTAPVAVLNMDRGIHRMPVIIRNGAQFRQMMLDPCAS